jgi:hypothetical protein
MQTSNWKSVAVLGLIAVAYYGAYARAQAQADAKATSVMAAMRKELGGEQKIGAIKGLSLRADYRREMGAGGPGGGTMMIMRGAGSGAADGGAHALGKMEIDIALPDKYLRSDIGTGMIGMTRTDGFDGTRSFQEVVPNNPGMTIRLDNPATDPTFAKGLLKRSQRDLARLMLGLTGNTQPDFPVTYAYAGLAESPDGKADMIDVAGPEDFKCRLFVDAETHLPLMLTYQDAEPRMITRSIGGPGGGGPGRGGPPPSGDGQRIQVTPGGGPGAGAAVGDRLAGLPPEERAALEKQLREAEATPPKMVEYRIFFADHRKVEGVSLPHQISRGTGSKTTEEWTVTSYKVNPAFKADRFKVGQ